MTGNRRQMTESIAGKARLSYSVMKNQGYFAGRYLDKGNKALKTCASVQAHKNQKPL